MPRKKKKYSQFDIVFDPDAPQARRKPKPAGRRRFLPYLIALPILIVVGLIALLTTSIRREQPVPGPTMAATPIIAGERVQDIAYHGDRMAVAGSSTLRLYVNNSLVRLFDGYDFDDITHSHHAAIAFNPAGTHLAALTTRRTTRDERWLPEALLTVWDTATGDVIHRSVAHTGGFSYAYLGAAIAYSADGNLLATGAGDGTLALRAASTFETVGTLQTLASGTQAIAFNNDGQQVALTTKHGDTTSASHLGAGLGVWDIGDLSAPQQIYGIPISPFDLHWTAFSPDGRYFAASTNRNPDSYGIGIWDLAAQTQVGTITLKKNDMLSSSVVSLAFNSSGDTLAFVHRQLLQAATGPVLGMRGAYELHLGESNGAIWLEYIAADDNNLWRWHTDTGATTTLRF